MGKSFWIKNNKLALNNNKPIYCSYCPCGKSNWYIYGRCTSSGNTITMEQADDPSTLTGGYILDGPFQKAKCKLYFDTKKSSYQEDLTKKCSGNSCTIVLSWDYASGRDLDIYVEILGEVYGYGHTTTGKYGVWYRDDQGPSKEGNTSSEKVALNRTKLISESIETAVIDLNAHWWGQLKNGKVTITYSSSTKIIKKDVVVTLQSSGSSKSSYQHVGTMEYKPSTDQFSILD